jgi:hypothetical protein
LHAGAPAAFPERGHLAFTYLNGRRSSTSARVQQADPKLRAIDAQSIPSNTNLWILSMFKSVSSAMFALSLIVTPVAAKDHSNPAHAKMSQAIESTKSPTLGKPDQASRSKGHKLQLGHGHNINQAKKMKHIAQGKKLESISRSAPKHNHSKRSTEPASDAANRS